MPTNKTKKDILKEHDDYKMLLEELMEQARELLLEVKKEKKKYEAKERLFDQFIYINSLKNAATTTKAYREAYEILEVSIHEFRNQTA